MEMADMKIGISGLRGAPEEKYGKILIMGRAQTGKTTVARKLADATGLKLLKTCTTRPKRTPDEDIYHFYTPEEAGQIPQEEKLFHTLAVDGFERWTNRADFLEAGIAVLDPTGAEPAVRLWQAHGYDVTVLYCSEPDETRLSRWIGSTMGSGPDAYDEAVVKFNHRERTEAPMFDELEACIMETGGTDDAGAMTCPNAKPEPRTVYGASCLERVVTSETDMDQFLENFTRRLLDAGGLPGADFPTGK